MTSIFENEYTEEEIEEEMLYILGTSGREGLTEKQLIDKVIENLDRKHLQIHLDVMTKEGILNVDKKTGGYSLTEKALKLKKDGKLEEYTANFAKKYHSDGTLKKNKR